MATIKNQWVAMCLGTIQADHLESLLSKGASTATIAATAGTSIPWLTYLLAQPVQAGFNGYPNAGPTYTDYLPGAPRLINSNG